MEERAEFKYAKTRRRLVFVYDRIKQHLHSTTVFDLLDFDYIIFASFRVCWTLITFADVKRPVFVALSILLVEHLELHSTGEANKYLLQVG